MSTQHSGLREDNNEINLLFNYLLSHALTAVRAIVRYRVWGGSRVSAAPNNRARLTACRWCSLPRVRQYRASSPQGSSRCCHSEGHMDQLMYASLFPHPLLA